MEFKTGNSATTNTLLASIGISLLAILPVILFDILAAVLGAK